MRAGVALDDLQPYAWRSSSIGGTPAMIQRGGALEASDWTVIAAAEHGDQLRSMLAAAAPSLDQSQVEILRVEKGIPAWGSELSDQVTPLEAGLRAAISDNKGCYTGQEVIARQLNYDKVTRRMVGLLLPADAPIAELKGATICGRRQRPQPGRLRRAPPSGRPHWSGPSPWPSSRVTLQSRALRLRSAPARARSSPRSQTCRL